MTKDTGTVAVECMIEQELDTELFVVCIYADGVRIFLSDPFYSVEEAQSFAAETQKTVVESGGTITEILGNRVQ